MVNAMRILIADDHMVVRAGLRQILHADFPNAEFAEAQAHDEVVKKVTDSPEWDLVVLDVSMPGGNGLELLKFIKQTSSKIPVVMLSMHSEEQFGLRALRQGASSYLNKESAPTQLVAAVRAALEGKRYMSPFLSEKLASSSADDGHSHGLSQLSERELSVMRLLYEGLALKEIAARLNISTKTVSTYRQRLLTKLELKSNAELVQYSIKNQLVGSDVSVGPE